LIRLSICASAQTADAANQQLGCELGIVAGAFADFKQIADQVSPAKVTLLAGQEVVGCEVITPHLASSIHKSQQREAGG
jgi:hypothetical protein